MPYLEHASKIRKIVWFPDEEEKRFINQDDRIKEIFDNKDFRDKDYLMISRYDLFKSTMKLDLFVIMVLMWGYPTKGQGKNIENILEPKKFDLTTNRLEDVRQKGNISIEDVKGLYSDGLNLSSISKLLYFLKIKVENSPALILDSRVIDATTRKDGFIDYELMNLKQLNYQNRTNKYPEYLRIISNLATKMNVQPDQIEMFLFEYGNNLKGHNGNYES